MTNVLILPGYGNSGAQHWQTLWEQQNPAFQRIQQQDWEQPICHDWVTTIDEAVQKAGSDTVIVAHSLGSLALAHWAAQTSQAIKGAMFVSIPNPHGENFPPQAHGFAPIPRQALPFPSLVVLSTNDPFTTLEHALPIAEAWGSEVQILQNAGHINANSGLGSWAQGFNWLQQFMATLA